MARNGLVGRSADLALLHTFLDQVAAGGGALVLSGEPGVGKSVVLDAASRSASDQGFAVLRAAGAEFEADVGYAVLNQLLGPFAGSVADLVPAHQDAIQAVLGLTSTGPANPLVVSTAVVTLLRHASDDRPLLAIVDDLQWLDRPSAAVLSFAARRLSGSRTGLLFAGRTDLDTFFDRGGLAEHELRPLDCDAAGDLLATRFPDLADGVRGRVLAEAQGNPLALLELPAALSGAQLTAEQALPDVLPLSRRLQTLFADRIAGLPMHTRHLLLLAALDGTGDLGVLQSAGDLAHLAAAEDAGLVMVDGRLEFRHPLVRSSMVNFATGGERRRAHKALADALVDRPDRRAWHLAYATAGADEEVAALLEQASQRALRRGDATGGVAALLRAADLSPRGADRSRRLVEAAYVGAGITGELCTVPRLLADAGRADPSPCGSLPAAVATAYHLLNGEGDVDTAHRLLASAIAGRSDAGDRGLIDALFALLQVCWLGGRPQLWEPLDAAIARLKPDPPLLLSVAAALYADPPRATPALLHQLDGLIASLPQETDPVRIVWTGRCASVVDRVSACRSALSRVVGDPGGAVALAIGATVTLCLDEVGTGEWDEALRLASDGIELCAAHGYRMLEWPLRYAQATVAAARGEFPTAHALADRMVRWAAPRGADLVLRHAGSVRALAALGSGDAEAAYRHGSAGSPWDLVSASVLIGRNQEAARQMESLHDALSPRQALIVAGCAGITASERFAAPFQEALAVPGAERWPFDLARVRLAYAERLRRTHATAAARTELTTALEVFDRLGARPWSERVRNELRAAGVGEGQSPLTPQEREIADLAATGLTNKQVGQRLHLSHRTIGAHLYRIFPKLGITTRAALRDALRTAAPDED